MITDNDIMIYNQKQNTQNTQEKQSIQNSQEKQNTPNDQENKIKNILYQTKPEINKIDFWEESEFEFLRDLTSDQRGKWGENFFNELVKKLTPYETIWNGDKNTSNSVKNEGIFDIRVITNPKKERKEIKTATTGVSRKKNKLTYTYQHENIYEENVWDQLIFIDIYPKGFYITIINHEDMVFDGKTHPIFKTKSTKHLSAWKFDMSTCKLKRGIKHGVTLHVKMDEINEDEITRFLIRHFE